MTTSVIPAHPSLSFPKRAFDVCVSLALLAALSPVMLAIAALVKLTSPGPVFYRRTIPGLRRKPFGVLKFRSMVQNAHELMQSDARLRAEYANNLKIANDPRITRVGRFIRKTSLDELPQFINVLVGDMSLVGPRMLGDIELAKYGEHQDKVLSVRPGITGLWQISGRHRTSFENRIALDMQYIDRWSFGLDLLILVKTPLAVLSMAGAS
jgi:lipopolysaccharide/colanic/teichoic acid biosynthesis glycosyltransferase